MEIARASEVGKYILLYRMIDRYKLHWEKLVQTEVIKSLTRKL